MADTLFETLVNIIAHLTFFQKKAAEVSFWKNL